MLIGRKLWSITVKQNLQLNVEIVTTFPKQNPARCETEKATGTFGTKFPTHLWASTLLYTPTREIPPF